jgi:hypothetical protein
MKRVFFCILRALKNSLLGAIFVQSALLGIVVVGWIYSLMRRVSLRRMERVCTEGGVEVNRERIELPAPVWIRGSGSQIPARLLGGLWRNWKEGLQGLFNTWVVTLPGCGLWVFSWWAGWNNSFYKGYEMAAYGAQLGLLGVGLFAGAMLYLPMAQAHQAATGSWRAFYQGRVIFGLIHQVSVRYLLLAVGYALFSMVILGFIVAPMFFPQMSPELQSLSVEEVRQILKDYFFWVGMLGFWCTVILKCAAARIYASGVLRSSLETGRISEALPEDTQNLLRLRAGANKAKVSIFRSGIRMALTPAVGVALCAIWAGVAFQIYVSEFLYYHPVRGFLNHPLIQLPWYSYIPT